MGWLTNNYTSFPLDNAQGITQPLIPQPLLPRDEGEKGRQKLFIPQSLIYFPTPRPFFLVAL
jgi:hypothetical protein